MHVSLEPRADEMAALVEELVAIETEKAASALAVLRPVVPAARGHDGGSDRSCLAARLMRVKLWTPQKSPSTGGLQSHGRGWAAAAIARPVATLVVTILAPIGAAMYLWRRPEPRTRERKLEVYLPSRPVYGTRQRQRRPPTNAIAYGHRNRRHPGARGHRDVRAPKCLFVVVKPTTYRRGR
jgi:hypothetical protein